MQFFFGFLWNLPLSQQNFRLIVLPFSAFPAGIRTFLPPHVSATWWLWGGMQYRRLAVVDGFKRTFGGPSQGMSNQTNSCTEKFNAPNIIGYFLRKGVPAFSRRQGEAQLLHPVCLCPHPAPWWPHVCPCCRMIPLPHSQGFSPFCCGCAVLPGCQPSCAEVTFIALHCGTCSTCYKYLKAHCMRGLQLGLPPCDARSRNSCFELDPFVCLPWLLQRMLFSFPLLHTGGTWAIVSLNALCCNFTFEICTF